jgi:predicted GNAT superfamily acetyltransferase
VGACRLLVAVPTDLAALRADHPQAGREWRLAVRETLGTLMDEGVTVTGFARDGWYVLTRAGEPRPDTGTEGPR